MPPDIEAGRAAKRCKRAGELNVDNSVTDPELGQQEAFRQQQVTAALPAGAAIPGAPAWFGPALAAGLAPLQANVNQINANVNQINANVLQIQSRQQNITVMHPTDTIQALANGAGNIPPNFPATLRDFTNLNNNDRRNLLVFYGLPPNPAPTREPRLRHFLGLPR